MDYAAVEALRERHAAWRLLRAANAPLILTFLGDFFVESNRGSSPAGTVAAALDDVLYNLNTTGRDTTGRDTEGRDTEDPDAENRDPPRYSRAPMDYLEDWAKPESGYLRRFYPDGSDEVHYEVMPAFEQAYGWIASLGERSFVGTESRLHIVVELLRQIVHGTETDPAARLAELHRRRAEIDAEIDAVESGELRLLDSAGIRDRYQQFATTARELLADFRQVEENFRSLDRAAREKIATWSGSKGDLLEDLVGSRSEIAASDQGRSFQAFYEYLLSQQRQDELAALLTAVREVKGVDPDPRVSRIRGNWSEAAERTQRTVRQISEQLRRFLDDQVWLENRRVIDLVRSIEASALSVRGLEPSFGLDIALPGIDITLPVERPLYRRSETPPVTSGIPAETDDADPELLFAQTYLDYAWLAENVRSVVPRHTSVELADLVALYPVEQGAAEIIGYMTLSDDDIVAEIDDAAETVIDYDSPGDEPNLHRRARLPQITVHRQ